MTALAMQPCECRIRTDQMAFLPLSLIPTLIVPFYIITHLVIFLQLREKQ
jgi:hypothetical protein